MASFRESLPRPSAQVDDLRSSDTTSDGLASLSTSPPYLSRGGFLPRSAVHFADGGAYPEIHVAQYPPGLGLVSSNKADAKNTSAGGVATVTVTASGDVNYDSIIAEGIGQDKIVHTKHADVVPKPHNVSSTLFFSSPHSPHSTC
jgi:SNW domain-containing protein 1